MLTSSSTLLPWPDYFGTAPQARADGMRHTVPSLFPPNGLGDLAQRIRGPLDRERLGARDPKTTSSAGGR